jgi:hypothetical protein
MEPKPKKNPLREDMAYEDRFRMTIGDYGRKITIDLNRGKARLVTTEEPLLLPTETVRFVDPERPFEEWSQPSRAYIIYID